jgi:hypothetical protein
MTPFEWTLSGFIAGLLVGRVWQYVRSERAVRETLRSLRDLMRLSPPKALETLDRVLKTGDR